MRVARTQDDDRLDGPLPGARPLAAGLPAAGANLGTAQLGSAQLGSARFGTIRLGDASLGTVRTLRVAIVSDVLKERNGVGTYYTDLVEHLRGHVEEIEHFCPSTCPSRFVRPMPGDATQAVSFPQPRTLRRRLAAFDPDVVIVPTPGPWGLLGARFATRRGLPIIVGYHTQLKGLSDLYWRGLRGSVSGFLLRLAHRWLFRRGAVVLVTSPALEEEARSLGAQAVAVMGTPLSPAFIGRPLRPLRPKIGTVLFAGRLAPEKNLEAVIDAAERLPNLDFVIVGDGPLREDIEACAHSLPNLKMLGWLPRPKVLDLLDSIDLIVLPSHVESLGSIALEGLARGRKVLVSPNCGITEWPMLGQALFQIGPDEKLAQAIGRLAEGTSARHHQKALSGPQGALQMSEWAIHNWLATLANHVAANHA